MSGKAKSNAWAFLWLPWRNFHIEWSSIMKSYMLLMHYSHYSSQTYTELKHSFYCFLTSYWKKEPLFCFLVQELNQFCFYFFKRKTQVCLYYYFNINATCNLSVGGGWGWWRVLKTFHTEHWIKTFLVDNIKETKTSQNWGKIMSQLDRHKNSWSL